jgi:putative endonuclease
MATFYHTPHENPSGLADAVSTLLSITGLDPATQTFFDDRMPQGHVYILASKRNGTLYIGVTNDLAARVHAHREGRGSAFTKKYNVTMLVGHETYDMVTDAIQRDTTMKRWPRRWKLALIENDNPDWNDLYESLL